MSFDLNKFSAFIFAPTLIILGIFGNIFGMGISSREKLKVIGPQSIYICMFVFDFINFPLIFKPYAQFSFNIDITIMSSLACKLYWYANYSLATISPMMNVYISIERFISITYPSKKFFLRKGTTQLTYIIAIVTFNLVIYVPSGIYFDVITTNENQTVNYIVCDFVNSYWIDVISWIDMVNRVIVPSALMIIFSLLISNTIFQSRRKISTNIQGNNAFKKDVRFALLSIFLNVVYILLSLPISIVVLFPNYLDNEFYIFFTILNFAAYCVNFYLMLAVNRIFRKEFFNFLCVNYKKRDLYKS